MAPTCIVKDASNVAVGAVLQQYIDDAWQPISFFSKSLQPAEKKYSTFDRELLAIYLAIKHFRHFVEGRQFQVLTDHKPLTIALNACSDRHSPRQAPQLDFIVQFTSVIRHVKGKNNVVADALSRIESNALMSGQSPVIDFQAMAASQQDDHQVRVLQYSQPLVSKWKLFRCWLAMGPSYATHPRALHALYFHSPGAVSCSTLYMDCLIQEFALHRSSSLLVTCGHWSTQMFDVGLATVCSVNAPRFIGTLNLLWRRSHYQTSGSTLCTSTW